MKKYLFFTFLLISNLAFSQLYQGPADGSVPNGVIVSTDNFSDFPGNELSPFVKMPVRNYMPEQFSPNYLNKTKPTGPEGSNVIQDPNLIGMKVTPTSTPIILKNFQGFNDPGNYIPPDPYIAVGPKHVVGVDNGRFRIWDKNTGLLLKTINANQWFATALTSASVFDPKISYDHFNKRWVMVWLDQNDPPNARGYFLISVSKDSIPLGTWYNWAIKSSLNGSNESGTWIDYQGVGFDANALYITGRMFQYLGYFQGCKFRIIGKTNLYANTAGQLTWTDLWDVRDPVYQTQRPDAIRPTIIYGTPTEYYFVGHGPYASGTYLNLYKLVNPLNSPTMTGVNVPVTAFNQPPLAQQLGGGSLLIESGSSYIRNEPTYRNGFLWATHSVASGTGYSNVNYTKINVSSNTAAEDVSFGGGQYYHFYPAIGVDKDQNLLINYSRSSPNDYIGAFFAWRLNTDPPNTLNGSMTIQAGKSNYVKDFGSGRNRWGDYNECWLDPSDQNSFWSLTEYAEAPVNTWGCWAANIRLVPFNGPHVYSYTDTANFGSIEVGLRSDTAKLKVYNFGTDTLKITNITTQTNNYALTFNPVYPIRLAAYDSTTIYVQFRPNIAGFIVDTMKIISNDNLYPTRGIALKGTGFIINPTSSGVIYGVASSLDSGLLVSINSTTGNATSIGPTGYGTITGLAVRPSSKQMFGTLSNPNNSILLRINANGGDAHPFVNIPVSYVRSLAFDNNDDLYGATTTGDLYKINVSTGAPTLIGSTHIPNLYSISINPVNGQLWGISVINAVYKINKLNADTTFVGAPGFSLTPGLAFDAQGKLFGITGGGNNISNLIKIDTTNAFGTLIGATGKRLNAITISPIPIGVQPISNLIPKKFALYQNYPNPFNPTTNIIFDIAKPGLVKIVVYDILGRIVRSIVNDKYEPGRYSITFSADNYASGVYFYRISTNDFVDVKKMLLIK